MINRQTLLTDLQRLLQRLEADLLERSESTEIVRVGEALRQEYEQAKAAARTAQNYEDWRSDTITQHAAAWVLSCVFIRFLEDNRLLDPPRLAGPAARLQQARDEHELYFRSNPRQTDRDYLLAVFDQLKELPATADVFGDHNPLRQLPDWLSGDAAGELLRFFQKINADDGLLIHDFTDPEWNTRFLGDLYQDLSEAARKKYALLQTPDFVEAFILDRTLEPALDEFGLTGKRSAVSGQQSAISDQQSAKNKKLTADSLTAESSFKLIDPACGSGHFLLGSFPRILNRWMKHEPSTNLRVLVQRALDSIHGVDVNPFAIAIARFRLLLVAMRACGVQRLADAPAFRLHLACGDSLYHGRQRQQVLDADWQDEAHYFRSEDTAELRRILREGTYHAVVANPPYITPKDAAANKAYRQLYPRSCHMKYSLSVPFMERLFALAIRGTTATASTARAQGRNLFDAEESSDSPQPTSPGFVGQITANSFMKREFGKKLIEDYFPTVDLTHVIDTSGAYIPGHGTPTVILFGRNRQPLQPTIRTVLGIRGEPSTPEDPAEGRVWTAILQSIDHPSRAATVRERTPMETHGGGESASSRARLEDAAQFVSAGDSQRELFLKHPWSIGGGGASELKEQFERGAAARLDTHADSIGITAFTLEDDIFVLPAVCAYRKSMAASDLREMVAGDELRDWQQPKCESVVFPYTADFEPVEDDPDSPALRYLWMARTCLANNKMFAGVTKVQSGLRWYEYGRLTSSKLRTPLSITFAEIATHNHFVLDRGGKVFKQTAPVIKLAADATEDQHLALLGLLNSSTACFWMKQVSHQKQMTGGDGVRIESRAKVPYAFSGTRLGEMPIPAGWTEGLLRERLLQLTREMDQRAARLSELTPKAMLARCELTAAAIRTNSEVCERERSRVRSEMILLQEEIDFTVYAMWGFASEDLLADDWNAERVVLDAGDRPFDILRGANEDGFPVPNGVPETWPVPLRQRWEARMAAIQGSPELRLIEDPHYKRRWKGRQGLFNHSAGADDLSVALQEWLLNRLESYFDFDGRMQLNDSAQRPSAPLADIGLHSLARLASVAGSDAEFHEVATVYRDDPAFDVLALVTELVQPEAVPLLPVLRYKDSGLRKRSEWEQTWDLQRKEDELSNQLSSITEQIAAIDGQQAANRQELNTERDRLTASLAKLTASLTVPPKYVSADFLSGDFWRLRGKLDVPKERWISFPHCDAADGTLMLCWAGYNHLQRAQAISGHYAEIEEREGGGADPRLPPLLACLLELLPWLKQWHNDVDPTYGVAMGDYFEGFVNEEARKLGLTLQDLRNWTPPARQRGRARRGAGR